MCLFETETGAVCVCETLQTAPCTIKTRTVKLCENLSGSVREQLEGQHQSGPLFFSLGSRPCELSLEARSHMKVSQ